MQGCLRARRRQGHAADGYLRPLPQADAEHRQDLSVFFIFGSPRSGTTLLAQTLTAHSQIEIPYETDFIVPAAFIFDRIRDPDAGRPLIHGLMANSTAFKGSLGQYFDAATLREIVYGADYTLPALLTAVYGHIARKSGKRMAGDKSPNDLQFVRILTKHVWAGPGFKIIHIVRDLRDVMVSVSERNWLPDQDIYFPRMWNMYNLYLHELCRQDAGRYRLIRYEDMVQDMEVCFRGLCRFLEVEFEPEMLDPGKRHQRFQKMPHHQGLFRPVTQERVGVHRGQLDAGRRADYERMASEGLRMFGYT